MSRTQRLTVVLVLNLGLVAGPEAGEKVKEAPEAIARSAVPESQPAGNRID